MPANTTTDALLFAAAFSRHSRALDWCRQRMVAEWGPILRSSELYSFHHTAYYDRTMGTGLLKQMFLFERRVALGELARLKIAAIQMESELMQGGEYPEPRPINIDPGLITLGKFMLATTKDNAHRIYLGDGIFAETTLRFQDGQFEPWPWTYADYREPAVLQFLNDAREEFRRRLHENPAS